jgi:hypothetical protein
MVDIDVEYIAVSNGGSDTFVSQIQSDISNDVLITRAIQKLIFRLHKNFLLLLKSNVCLFQFLFNFNLIMLICYNNKASYPLTPIAPCNCPRYLQNKDKH